jgi:hypothetical protein
MEKNLLQRLLDLPEEEIISFMGNQPLNSPEHKTAEQALEILHRRGGKKIDHEMLKWTVIGVIIAAAGFIAALIPEVRNFLLSFFNK